MLIFSITLHISFLFIDSPQLPSASCRLLKVKPEERLTIEGVLAHPWLNCTEALDNVLPSAQMMMDKVSGKLTYAPGFSAPYHALFRPEKQAE